MPNYGPACKNCSGEDCPCCEVYLEYAADMREAANHDPRDDEYDFNEGEYDDYEEETDPGDMDGDATSALASAGFGSDEDYEHDTPLGELYGDGFDE